MVKKRSIVISVILSFLTCGLYGLYWIIKVTNEMNTLLYKKDATGGLICICSYTSWALGSLILCWRKTRLIPTLTHIKDCNNNDVVTTE